ncbi:RICIN domain-containing protein [Streptomyces xanthophaeus]|uniref:RICIN domain-containing protein n=1 Tax=Streptomyces xanthophaeus TaxID=67385 RepID=UPI00099D7C38|nr:RICIN domain-containing protein [Streptomyces xanthophaeus]
MAPALSSYNELAANQADQRWKVIPLDDGEHTITSANSGLLLNAAAASDGATVTQQKISGSALQRWTID